MAWVEGIVGNSAGTDGCFVYATFDDAAPEGTDIYDHVRVDNIAGQFDQSLMLVFPADGSSTELVVPKGQQQHFHFVGPTQQAGFQSTLVPH